jgi:hypothetical protein
VNSGLQEGERVMKKPCVVPLLVLLFCCALVVGAVGCADSTTSGTAASETAGSTVASAASTTAAPETATTEPAASGAWTNLNPAGDLPAARAGQSMVYDQSSGKVILFGGWDAADFNDTWAYDPPSNTWSDLSPAGDVPPVRHDHAMACDESTGKVILFGGMDASTYQELNDTWAYDPADNAWTNLNPAGAVPEGRCLHFMTYDPTAGKVILFGGSRHGGCLGDIWAYDSATNAWTDLSPSGDKPLARYGCQLVQDPDLRKVVLFGGSDGHLLGDTWAYDSAANTWTNLVSVASAADKPPARQFYAMAYDSEAQRTVLFGGCGVATLGDTWAYDSAANTWTNLSPAGDVPSARTYPAMVYATGIGKFILFGGSEDVAPSNPTNDTWSYDPTP